MSEQSWNTVLFDRIISVKLIWENKKDEDDTSAEGYDIEIKGNEFGGIKPDISFSASLLPGELFHEVTLTIKNYKLPYDIRKYTKMEITAGYRRDVYDDSKEDEELTRVFPIEIFYSYCMTPAPDSVTVFKGIIVSSFVDNIKHFFSKNVIYRFSFYRDVTVIEYIRLVVDMLNSAGYNVALKECIPEEVKNTVIRTGPKGDNEYGIINTFTTVPNLFNSIAAMLEASYRNLGKDGSFNINFAEGKLIISCTDGLYSKEEPVIDLNSISSAALNAGVITITAPWYPPLIPGDIIRVSREFIDGSDLPNVIDVDSIMGVDNKYRILTMDISFATIASENSMKITALPLRYVEDASSWKTDKEIDEYKHVWEVKQKQAEEIINKIKETEANTIITELYKNPDGSVTKEDYITTDGNITEVKTDKNKTYKISNATTTDKTPIVHMHVGEVPEEKNPLCKFIRENKGLFSGLSLKKYGPLDGGYMTSVLCSNLLYKNFPVLDVMPLRELGLDSAASEFTGVFDGSYLWPVVYAATYITFLENNKNKAVKYETAMNDFNEYALPENTALMILPGHSIMYPQITSWDSIKGSAFAGLYKAAAKLKTVEGPTSKMLNSIGTILENM